MRALFLTNFVSCACFWRAGRAARADKTVSKAAAKAAFPAAFLRREELSSERPARNKPAMPGSISRRIFPLFEQGETAQEKL